MDKFNILGKRPIIISLGVLLVIFLSNFVGFTQSKAQIGTIRPIIFPVIGAVTYYDDFGAPRVGHTHEGNDLMGKKMMPLVAAVSGTIRQVVFPEASWGFAITIEDDEGYTYHYLHMNNDMPGTDNGQGSGMNAYAVDMKRGNRVVAGQLIGWMGDSGNAETIRAHLHFEIRKNREPFSPFASLQAATKIKTPVDYPSLPNEVLPFGNFQGGASVAAGNLDEDVEVEFVAGAGPGGGPHVQIFDEGTNLAKFGFFPYVTGFRGGVDLATGDLDGDGIDEIITGPGSGGGPNVKAFKADGTQVLSFMAYTSGFVGGVKVAAADLNNDGKAEIITSPGSGGGPHVKIFSPDGNIMSEFLAYAEGFKGGIDVSAVKASGSSQGLIVTAPNTGGGPHIKTFDLAGLMQSEFLAYDGEHRGGVRVAVSRVGSDVQIITAPLLGGPDFRKFDAVGNKLDSDTEFEEWWMGSWDVASYYGNVFASTGPNSKRRTSVREIDFVQNQRFRFENPGND